jgi:uncharacterized protein involved in cysteine biosynthesis
MTVTDALVQALRETRAELAGLRADNKVIATELTNAKEQVRTSHRWIKILASVAAFLSVLAICLSVAFFLLYQRVNRNTHTLTCSESRLWLGLLAEVAEEPRSAAQQARYEAFRKQYQNQYDLNDCG